MNKKAFSSLNVLLIGVFPESPRVRWTLAPYVLKGYFEKNSLHADKFYIEVFDVSNSDTVETILNHVTEYKPAIVGFSCYVWNIDMICETALKTRKLAPEIKIILGGPEISHANATTYTEVMNIADFCVIGEGEDVFMQLLEDINNGLASPKAGGAKSEAEKG